MSLLQYIKGESSRTLKLFGLPIYQIKGTIDQYRKSQNITSTDLKYDDFRLALEARDYNCKFK